MPQLNFSKQFAEAVASGIKRQTIRAKRKNPIQVHDVLHLFTGLRTKQARRLLPPQFCREARLISMRRDHTGLNGDIICIQLENHGKMSADEIRELAAKDGFSSLTDFLDWFLPKGTNEFHGQLITW